MKHVWLADHFSVPQDTLCMRRAPSPNADHFCLKAKGHAGACECTFHESFKVRDYSHKDKERHEHDAWATRSAASAPSEENT